MSHKAPLTEIHRQHLAAARGLRKAWQQSLEQDGLTTDAEARDLRISLISTSHYWLDAAIEARRQTIHRRKHGERMVGFRFVTASFLEYNREYQPKEAAMNTFTYTNLAGALVTTPVLDWLEDGHTEDGEPCARYYCGEEYGDSQSVWLDEDMLEVQV